VASSPATEKSNNFIKTTLKLFSIDHNLSVKSEQLRELVLIYNLLSEEFTDSDVIAFILKDKASYLIHKILTRFQEDEKSYLYAIDFVDRELNSSEFTPILYNDFCKKTDLHHSESRTKLEKQNFEEYIEESINRFNLKQSLNFEEFHGIVKYFKDDNASKEQLESLLSAFKQQYSILQVSENRFDRWAFKITENYLANNLFSFFIDNNLINDDEIIVYIQKLKHLQSISKIKNYFPFYKACNHLIKSLDEEFKKEEISTDIVRKKIEILENLEKDLYDNLEWCKDRNFISFQAPFDECIKNVEHKGEYYKLFMASSITLPLNYESLQKESGYITNAKIKFRSLYETHNIVSRERNHIKEIKNSVVNQDKKSIEILSIFAAIVLFVISNIQIFATAKNFSDALRFMLIFGYVISIFVLLIWIITREYRITSNRIPLTHWIIIVILSLSTIGAFIISSPMWNINNIELKKDSTLRGDIVSPPQTLTVTPPSQTTTAKK
jgi:hypothetical protein